MPVPFHAARGFVIQTVCNRSVCVHVFVGVSVYFSGSCPASAVRVNKTLRPIKWETETHLTLSILRTTVCVVCMRLFIYIREVIEKLCTAVSLLNHAVDLHKLELTHFTCFRSSALPLYISAPPSCPCPLLYTTTIRFILQKIFKLLYQQFKCDVRWGVEQRNKPCCEKSVSSSIPISD